MEINLSEYTKPDGFIDTIKLTSDVTGLTGIKLTYATFFESDELANQYPILKQAYDFNEQKSLEQEHAESGLAEQAWQRAIDHQATDADLKLLNKVGWLQHTYNNPESNAPDGYYLSRDGFGDNDPYADQVGLEERAADHRL